MNPPSPGGGWARRRPFGRHSRALALLLPLAAPALPDLHVTRDDTVIRESCLIHIAPGLVIPDLNTNGVLQIAADGITVRFAPGTELRGTSPEVDDDRRRGMGIRIEGARDVRIENGRVHGFFNGLVATRADRLVIQRGDYSGNYRQRLRSTPEAEDSADWLFPHHNDDRPWRDQYGGAICLEHSRRVTVHGVHVRRGQNGILLDQVHDSRIYDNDCSFLSGWGLALWRSSRNLISRNAFDFCVRGHVEGVYNRGQDSAGILCFEQCNSNVFIENSATHGGDGFFGFAGREALGELWMEAERTRWRAQTGLQDVDDRIQVPPAVAREFSLRGCNTNVFIGNDLSYASAHGLELTFSEGNIIARNRLVENAICGIWGGYSSDTLIADNEISGNGGMAYGLERGGINMEHASGNRILRNQFLNNKCAIHLWWDDDAALLRLPGVAGNARGVTGNAIAGNSFVITPDHPFRNLRPDDRLTILHLRDSAVGHVRSNLYVGNRLRLSSPLALEFEVAPGCAPLTNGSVPRFDLPTLRPIGDHRPVGARPHLRGRHQILLDEWGPWDHQAPFVRRIRAAPGEVAYEIHGLSDAPVLESLSGSLLPDVTRLSAGRWRAALRANAPGVWPYRTRLAAPRLERVLTGTLVSTTWDLTFFPWTVDPREDLPAWRQLAESPSAVRATTPSLDFSYGWGGPRDQKLGARASGDAPGPDHFGTIARTRLRLPAGEWRFRTLSDDGVRVSVDGRVVIENWTWHGPTQDEGTFHQPEDAEVTLEVEHFEIDGYAVLRVELEPAPATR